VADLCSARLRRLARSNIMANDYYSLRSYEHFCFFCQINNSKKKKDEFAFFIFFTFKGERADVRPSAALLTHCQAGSACSSPTARAR
jgi:hypothetical protein